MSKTEQESEKGKKEKKVAELLVVSWPTKSLQNGAGFSG